MKKTFSLVYALLFFLMSVCSCISAVHAMSACTAEFSVYAEKGGTVKIEGVSASDGMELPMPENSVIKIQDSPVNVTMEYEEPGEYLYKVSQIPGDQNGVVYDTAVFTVAVSVFVNEKDLLQAVVTSKKDGALEKPADILFVNTQLTPSETPTPITTPTPTASAQNATSVSGGTAIGSAGKSADVQTSDENMIFSIIAAGISLAGIVGVLVWKKKKSR